MHSMYHALRADRLAHTVKAEVLDFFLRMVFAEFSRDMMARAMRYRYLSRSCSASVTLHLLVGTSIRLNRSFCFLRLLLLIHIVLNGVLHF